VREDDFSVGDIGRFKLGSCLRRMLRHYHRALVRQGVKNLGRTL
jgi:hypothetical protein